MASLEEIRKRKISVENTAKITKAMEMVSISKTKKYSRNVAKTRLFKDAIHNILFEIIENNTIKNEKLFSEKKEYENTLWVIITSDTGLCGGYNLNIFKLLKDKIKPNDKVIIKGTKGVGIFNTKFNKTKKEFKSYTKIDEDNLINLGTRITKRVIHNYFEKDLVQQVNLVWTKYVNQITFEPIITQLLPLQAGMFNEQEIHKYKLDAPIEYEPDFEAILKGVLPEYISSSIIHNLSESLLAEYSSRRIAMENATNNSKDLLDVLELDYNKARQQKITQEITEIVAGSEGTS